MSIINRSKKEIFTIDQVPEEYKEEVKKELENHQETDIKEEVTKGELGEPISSKEDIKEVFNDSDCVYFGHGTSGENSSVIKPIFETGLIVYFPGTYSHTKDLMCTAVIFDYGYDEFFEDHEEELNNWKHLDSKYIIILALPKKYLLHHGCVKPKHDEFKHYYVVDEENKMKVRPEFVKGVYSANSHTFTPNKKFYKNLSKEKQEKLFKELTEKYMREFSKSMAIIPEDYELPLNEEQKKKLYIEWYAQKIRDCMNSNYEEIVDKVVEQMTIGKPDLNVLNSFDDWDDDFTDSPKAY